MLCIVPITPNIYLMSYPVTARFNTALHAGLQCCEAMWTCKWVPTYHRNIHLQGWSPHNITTQIAHYWHLCCYDNLKLHMLNIDGCCKQIIINGEILAMICLKLLPIWRKWRKLWQPVLVIQGMLKSDLEF
jgi:hypothetical protein